jgi:hypothetical protein
MLHYITLDYITLHYVTLHYITLHYITLHIPFTDTTFVPRQLNMKQVKNIRKMTHTGFKKGNTNMCKNI